MRTFLMLKDLCLTCLCVQMRHHGNRSISSSNGSMGREHEARIANTEDEAIPWMVHQNEGADTITESSTAEVCRREVDCYLD